MKVGFIGLGIMGKPMSKNLIKAGYNLVVYSNTQKDIDEIVAAGAEGATSAADVASRCEVIVTMVPNSPHVRNVTLEENGIIETAKPGTVVIDMSSIDPNESRAIGAELAKKGIDMLDSPVSGGEPKAIDGTLSAMVGGKKETFDRMYSLLMSMAGSAVYVGELGSGNVAKLSNQMVVASNIAILAEALVFAKKSGADPELVYKAIRGGLAGSTVMDAKAPMMLEGNLKPGFRVELHVKDLNNVVNAAHTINSPIPLTSSVMEMMQSLISMGLEKADHSSLIKFYEQIANISVEKSE